MFDMFGDCGDMTEDEKGLIAKALSQAVGIVEKKCVELRDVKAENKRLQAKNKWLKKAYELATSIIFRELPKEQMATLEQAVEQLKTTNKEIKL